MRLMKRGTKQNKVFIAMSGGVDSSVAAHLLKKQGFDLVGVYMRPWQPEGFPCLWEQDRSDALRVATQLDIPFETWDFSHEYERLVSGPMVRDYRRGITPNPDVECNRHIKFGYFYREARKRGADFIATGHYARIRRAHGVNRLTTAVDTSKDQTYFLWGLSGAHLSHILFPLGGLQKTEVRRIAREQGIITADKKDSQGVCFVGPLDMKSFLLSQVASKKGVIKHTDGRVLGMHDGAAYYTIGQRHGLDIKDGSGPYFVIRKDIRTNVIIVGGERDLLAATAAIRSIHWITEPPAAGAPLRAKIRYRTPTVKVVIEKNGIRFSRPMKSVTAGQSIVFYRGTQVLGGAILR